MSSRPGQRPPTRRVLLALAGVVGLGAWCACTPAGSPDASFLGLHASRLGEGRRRVNVARRGARDPRDLAAFQGVPANKWLTGTVTRAAPFGLFVSVTAPNGAAARGLVHVSQIRDGFVDDAQKEAEVGQKVKVRVVRVDAAAGIMDLSMKEAGAGGGGGGGRAPSAPSDLSAFQGISSSEWLPGKEARIAPFGLLVTVSSADGTATADGLEVKVRVVRVDAAGGKMAPSMKEAGAGGGGGGGRAPRAKWDVSAFQGISSSEWLTGKVADITPFGLFVTVSTPDGKATADGLVHITQIRDGHVESTEGEAQLGQEVQVRVISVDAGAGKLRLSMKGEQA